MHTKRIKWPFGMKRESNMERGFDISIHTNSREAVRRIHHRKSWSGYMEQARPIVSSDSTESNLVWWCDVRDNSCLSHFAALFACTPRELNGRLVWREDLTYSYVRITEKRLDVTHKQKKKNKRKKLFFLSKFTPLRWIWISISFLIKGFKFEF